MVGGLTHGAEAYVVTVTRRDVSYVVGVCLDAEDAAALVRHGNEQDQIHANLSAAATRQPPTETGREHVAWQATPAPVIRRAQVGAVVRRAMALRGGIP